jgi:hypothetical protein
VRVLYNRKAGALQAPVFQSPFNILINAVLNKGIPLLFSVLKACCILRRERLKTKGGQDDDKDFFYVTAARSEKTKTCELIYLVLHLNIT